MKNSLLYLFCSICSRSPAGDLSGTGPGPGFGMMWTYNLATGYGAMRWKVLQRTNSKYKQIRTFNDVYLVQYPIGVWYHYVLTYRCNNLDINNNMDMYINGVPRPDSEKEEAVSFTFNHTDSYHGKLDIGRMYLDEMDPSQMGNIKIDELIFWEEVLPHCDVIRLY